jgi:pyruvate formate lyase activating enzyme
MWDAGVWVEVTTLIIPGYNDSEEQLRALATFLADVSTDMPWHVSGFYPMYRLKDAPRTGAESLRRGVRIGHEAGLKYVYAGNIPGEEEDTKCPACGETLIERSSFRVIKNSVIDGLCPKCGTSTAGVWS